MHSIFPVLHRGNTSKYDKCRGEEGGKGIVVECLAVSPTVMHITTKTYYVLK